MRPFLSACLSGIALTALLGAGAALAQSGYPPIVTGKVVAVSHEKITLNNQTYDKITLQVDRCDARGTLSTLHYTPATVSDRTALGHLFGQVAGMAQMPNLERQQQINGYGMFWVDGNGRIMRTGLLGAQVGCNDAPRLSQQFGK